MQLQMERNNIEVAPVVMDGALKAMYGLEGFVARSGIEKSLLELVKLRASQLNSCAYCINMHTKDARARGESVQRIYLVRAWRETPLYSHRECAGAPLDRGADAGGRRARAGRRHDEARQVFADDELACPTVAVIAINGWNRINVALGTVLGSYELVR